MRKSKTEGKMRKIARGFVALVFVLSFVILAACGSSESDPPTPKVGSLKVVNGSYYTIYHVYLSPSGTTSWGPDQLGNLVIPSGYSQTITGFTPGRYDIKVTDVNGSAAYYYDIIITDGGTFTFTLLAKPVVGKTVPMDSLPTTSTKSDVANQISGNLNDDNNVKSNDISQSSSSIILIETK